MTFTKFDFVHYLVHDSQVIADNPLMACNVTTMSLAMNLIFFLLQKFEFTRSGKKSGEEFTARTRGPGSAVPKAQVSTSHTHVLRFTGCQRWR